MNHYSVDREHAFLHYNEMNIFHRSPPASRELSIRENHKEIGDKVREVYKGPSDINPFRTNQSNEISLLRGNRKETSDRVREVYKGPSYINPFCTNQSGEVSIEIIRSGVIWTAPKRLNQTATLSILFFCTPLLR